jgi:pimeloyl-ACP methyl ester carboxylesterase
MWTAAVLALSYGAIFLGYGVWVGGRVGGGAPLLPYLLALPLVYLAVPFLIVLVWFALAWAFRADRPREVRLGLAGTLRLFWHEFVTIAGNAPRMILYRVLMRDPPAARAELPVLLVHGVLCNAGVWHPFAQWAARKGIGPIYALSYGPPLASIELFVDQVAAKIDRILEETQAKQVVVIAHSMGGLVMRAYFRRCGGAKVAKLVTVGAPHEGSVHAWMAAGTSLAQIRPRNPWLVALGAPDGPEIPPIVSIWSWHDSMVAPQTSSRITYGDNIVLGGVAHNALLRDPQVFGHLAEEIERAR